MKTTAFVLALVLSGCTMRNQYGECISPFDEGKPELEYQVDAWNTVLSIVFVETIFAPVLWAIRCGKCPVGRK